MSVVYYETGIEEPEILGSGSQFFNIVTTANEEEAFCAYRTGGRNYLRRFTYSKGQPRVTEWWSEREMCWQK